MTAGFNHHVYYGIMELEFIAPLKGTQKFVTFMVTNLMWHLHQFTPNRQVELRVNQLSKFYSVHNRHIKQAIDTLIENNMIKQIRPWSRTNNTPAVYVMTKHGVSCLQAYSLNNKNLYPKTPKPIASLATDNKIIINDFKEGDHFNNDSSLKGKKSRTVDSPKPKMI